MLSNNPFSQLAAGRKHRALHQIGFDSYDARLTEWQTHLDEYSIDILIWPPPFISDAAEGLLQSGGNLFPLPLGTVS